MTVSERIVVKRISLVFRVDLSKISNVSIGISYFLEEVVEDNIYIIGLVFVVSQIPKTIFRTIGMVWKDTQIIIGPSKMGGSG